MALGLAAVVGAKIGQGVEERRWSTVMKRPALLARLPKRFWWRPDPETPWPDDWTVLPPGAEDRFPQLSAGVALWKDQIEALFRRLDHAAILLQQQFWRQQLTLLIGGFIATALGSYQAARGGGNPYVAAAQAVLTGLLTGVTVLVRARHAQQSYLTARLKAERIKSEFFLFLARAGNYAAADRDERLMRRVKEIADAEEVR